MTKTFDIVCPYCNGMADVMAYKRIEKSKLKVIYICTECGNSDKEIHYLYEEE